MVTATLPKFPSLITDERADVCIVGAGIAGLTTAYLLRRAGKSVVVLDDGPIVSGETERTTAHLVTALGACALRPARPTTNPPTCWTVSSRQRDAQG